MTKNEQLYAVLLYSLYELGGSASRPDVLDYIQEKGYWRKNDINDEYGPKRPHEKKWRNFFSFARKHLVDKGYILNESRGIWEVSTESRNYFRILAEKIINLNSADKCDFTDVFYNVVHNSYDEDDILEDKQLLNYLSEEVLSASVVEKKVSDMPILRQEPLIKPSGRKVYKRDPEISKKALFIADYKCEIDCTHTTFIRKNIPVQYTEPHHLIPMSQSDHFKYSLDREQNIFSLCCNCHNQIHYGRKEDVRILIKKLFELRKDEISKIIDREIELEELYKIYAV